MTRASERRGRDRGRQVPALVAAIVVSASVLVAAFCGALPASPSRISLPHREAGLSCSSCHEPGKAPGSRCVSCHGEHSSRRPAHARLMEGGGLRCNDCHDVHGGDAGIRWSKEPGELPVVYSVEAERPLVGAASLGIQRTLPLVPLSACIACHDIGAASDPISRCVGDRTGFSLCFDEHQTASAGTVAKGVCQAQHGGERPWLWEAAGREFRRGSLQEPPRRGAAWWWLAPVGVVIAFGGQLRVRSWFRSRRQARSEARVPARKHSLPVIDQSRCLGCEACVDVCPFEVLRVERYVAVVAQPEACCGIASCEEVCPNGSLSFFDAADREEPDPVVDADGRVATWPGLYLAGEAAGTPLIKNAIAEGERCVRHLAARMPSHAESLDLLIVGAGPAGISAALTAQSLGLRFRVIEQASVAESIRSFPRGKLVFAQPLHLPAFGPLWLQECTKEELLSKWLYLIRRQGLAIQEGRRLTDLQRRGDVFLATIEDVNGDGCGFVRVARVLLAVGRRGSPRKLDFPIGESVQSKVFYHLADAKSLAGKRVVICGLGDVAIEACVALVRQEGTQVTLIHRGAGRSRAKARNQAELDRLLSAGRVRLIDHATIAALSEEHIELAGASREELLRYDALFVMIGTAPQAGWIARIREPGFSMS